MNVCIKTKDGRNLVGKALAEWPLIGRRHCGTGEASLYRERKGLQWKLPKSLEYEVILSHIS